MSQPNMYRVEMIQENNRDIREMRELRAKREQNEKIETYFRNVANAETEKEIMNAIEVQICSPYTQDGIPFEAFIAYVLKAGKAGKDDRFEDYRSAMTNMKRFGIPFSAD